jgi:hypothetical protein
MGWHCGEDSDSALTARYDLQVPANDYVICALSNICHFNLHTEHLLLLNKI